MKSLAAHQHKGPPGQRDGRQERQEKGPNSDLGPDPPPDNRSCFHTVCDRFQEVVSETLPTWCCRGRGACQVPGGVEEGWLLFKRIDYLEKSCNRRAVKGASIAKVRRFLLALEGLIWGR